MDKYDVKILPQRWGNTPFGFIKDNPEWSFLTPHILTTQQLPQQPEIWMQITVPNEFQPIGKYNIGCTAGIESTIAPAEWVEGCNRMNLILGSSEHTIKVLKESKFEKRDQKTNQTIGHIQFNTESEVIFEGVRTEVYKSQNTPCKVNFNIKESFAYLFVGHWMQGGLGEDRKNVGLLIKAFFETFKNKKDTPALILKTSTVGSSYMDRDEIIKRIKAIRSTVKAKNVPRVYLLHGDFTDEEMNEIYNHTKVKAMVNITKGEGFGRPLLEFTRSKKPIIASNWSGHLDFLNAEFASLVPGEVKQVHESVVQDRLILKESKWFSPDINFAALLMKDYVNGYKAYETKGKRLAHYCKENFSFEKMQEKLEAIMDKNAPKKVEIKLPNIKKISLPKKDD